MHLSDLGFGDRPIHELGDVAIAEAVIDSQEQGRTSVIRQEGQGALDSCGGFPGQQNLFGVDGSLPPGMGARDQIVALLLPALALALLQVDESGDAEQPRPQPIRLADRTQAAESPIKGILGGIGRPRTIPEKVVEKPEDRRPELIVDAAKGLPVTRTRPDEEILST